MLLGFRNGAALSLILFHYHAAVFDVRQMLHAFVVVAFLLYIVFYDFIFITGNFFICILIFAYRIWRPTSICGKLMSFQYLVTCADVCAQKLLSYLTVAGDVSDLGILYIGQTTGLMETFPVFISSLLTVIHVL